MYWGGFAIYVVLSVLFIADVIRNRELTSVGKTLWIVALLLVPVLSWLVYGIWRLRSNRGLAA
jgi:Phospholipase_D-nuclease N-terminal